MRLFNTTAIIIVVSLGNAHADVAVPGLFSDHAVLQQGVPVPVWGTAEPEEQVTVTIGEQKISATADKKGHWQVKIAPLPAGGPHEMTITGRNTLKINDIMIGEVWVCSGQSNMAFTVQRANNGEQEAAAANKADIRLLVVPRTMAKDPQTTVNTSWKVCSPESVKSFSAVGYFFGRELHKCLNVPVGLIDTSWGGTPAEAWTSQAALDANPEFKPIFNRWEQAYENHKRAQGKESTNNTNAKPRKQGGRGNPAGKQGKANKGGATQSASRPAIDPNNSPQRPTVLYNAMIHPLIPYAIKGAIWYQGEANAKRACQYRKLLPTMIRNWREDWGQGDFPFLIVQLANYQAGQTEPYKSAWAELREAQTMTLAEPKTGMAVTIDIGEPKDIHPRNKQEVGRRLSLAARVIAYGEKIPYSGPMYQSKSINGRQIQLHFSNTDGGLVARDGGPLKGFAIAGEDRQFIEATAMIENGTIVVSSDKISEPLAVRYGWADNPECNLVNGAGLPAIPFRTDDWPGVTANEQ